MVRVAIDFCCSMEHWVDHLAPVYKALKPDERGHFWVLPELLDYTKTLRLGAEVLPAWPQWGKLTVIAGEQDRRRVRPQRVVRFEHGAGFSFGGSGIAAVNTHTSYAGGSDQRNVAMFLNPNRWAHSRWREAYPKTPSYIVGCPKLDKAVKLPKPKNAKPVVALTWHWDCRACPETRSAFRHYARALDAFTSRTDIEIIGHCHPRTRRYLKPWYADRKIEFVQRLDEVFARADLYINDSSSTLYEFAALDRPVVVVNAPWYQRSVQHGLRFWDHADIGPQVNEGSQMNRAVDVALEDSPLIQARRRKAIAEIYPHLGRSASEAAKRLREYMKGRAAA